MTQIATKPRPLLVDVLEVLDERFPLYTSGERIGAASAITNLIEESESA